MRTSRTGELLSHLLLRILSRALTSSTLYVTDRNLCVCLQLYVYDFPRKHSCLNSGGFFSLSSQSIFQGYIHDTQFIFNLENTHNTISTELPQLPPLPINICLCSNPFLLSFCFSRKKSHSWYPEWTQTFLTRRRHVQSHPFYSRPSTLLSEAFAPTPKWTRSSLSLLNMIHKFSHQPLIELFLPRR